MASGPVAIRVRVFVVAILTILCLVGTSGCVTTAGGTVGELGRAGANAASDLKSARLALGLFDSGKSTFAVTETALSDALTNITGTQSSVSSMSVSTNSERRARARANAEIAEGVAAINAAQDIVDDVPGATSTDAALRRLAKSARALTRFASASGVKQ